MQEEIHRKQRLGRRRFLSGAAAVRQSHLTIVFRVLVLAIAVLVTLLCPDRASAAQNGPDKSPTLQAPLTDAKPTIPRFDSIVDLFRADSRVQRMMENVFDRFIK